MAQRSVPRHLLQMLCQGLSPSVRDIRLINVNDHGCSKYLVAPCNSVPTVNSQTFSSLVFLPAQANPTCWTGGQARAFAIRRQRRREDPKSPDIPTLSNPVDWDIDADKVLVVDDGMKAVMPLSQAVKMAHSRNLNVVQVSIQNSQPVCRLQDFKKMQHDHRELQEKKHAQTAEKERRIAKMKGVRLGWNIAQHDLEVKMRKVQEFLDKGRLVAVSTTYDHKPKKWPEQYPKAVEVSKTVWSHFKDQVHSWYDYSESGNKQVTIMYSSDPPSGSGRHTLLPWEPGSMLPPFLQALQNNAQQQASNGTNS